MAKIKTHLIDALSKEKIFDLIPDLITYTAENYRPYDPGQYLYNLVTRVPFEEKFTDGFIELAYTTLISWNMNQRGAKLSEFEEFKTSLLDNRKSFESLKDLKIEELSSPLDLKEQLLFLFNDLRLVQKNKPQLVTFSKTMHYFLPNLLMPIDRSYTLMFFYHNTNFDKYDNSQSKLYHEILVEFWQLATKFNFDQYLDNRWNRNIPKIIDNIIIAYISKQRINTST